MGNTSIKVRRTGQVVDVLVATADAEARKRLLAPHHGSATVECMCAQPPIPMTVAHRTIPTETWYLVAADREQAKRHAPDCLARHDNVDAAGAPKEAAPMPRIDATGVTLSAGFLREWREPKGRTAALPPTQSNHHDPSDASSRTGLGALLGMLWSQAGLNEWKPAFAGKREWGVVRHRLLDAAARIRSGHDGTWALSDDLFVPPQYDSRDARAKAASEAFHGALQIALDRRRIVFMLGEIRSTTTLPDGGLTLRLHHALPSITVPQSLKVDLEHAASSHGGWVGAGRDDRRAILARIRRDRDGECIVCIDAGLLRVDGNAIPFSSSDEHRVAALLVEQGRTFAKPFTQGNAVSWWSKKMDAIGVKPGYVLTDIFPGVFGEVFGCTNDPKRRECVAETLATYRIAGVPIWSWDASVDLDPPPFPEKSR